MNKFSNLPAGSRVWVYQSDRAFSDTEAKEISTAIEQFVSQWLAHKAKVIGDGALLYNRFIVLAADEEKLHVSGCSIDSTVRFIRELGAKYDVNFFDRFYTCYWSDNKIVDADFDHFKTLMEQGIISDDTIVFNNLVTTIEGLEKNWQIPLSQSWHKRVQPAENALKL
jgi:hypothetical protein